MRLILFLLVLLALASSACTTSGPMTARNGAAVNSETPAISPTPPGDTYWVVSVLLLNGSVEFSDVLQLPTDDKETVAAAVDAWGDPRGRPTAKVYAFSSAAEAQKWRSEQGNVLHIDGLTRNDLIPRLCVGQAKPDATDYWVIAVKKTEMPGFSPVDKVTTTHYISSPLLLPPHSERAIAVAVGRWAMRSSGGGRSSDDANTRKFANIGDAEAFISKSGMEHLDLTAETLNKYLCANQPEESQPSPKPQPKH